MGTTWYGLPIEVVAPALAFVLVAVTPLWHLARFPVHIVHEWGHAAILLVTPGKPAGILVHPDGSAETYAASDEDGDPGVLFLLAGYPAAASLGLVGVWAVEHGWSTQVLLAIMASLVFVLALIRNGFGLLVLTLVTAGVAGFFWYGPADQRPLFVALSCWLLLLGSVRNAYEQYVCLGQQDSELLGEISAIRPGAWRMAFLATNLAAVGAACWLSLGT